MQKKTEQIPGIKELRKLCGKSQNEVARFCGVAIPSVQRWDNSLINTRASNLLKIAAFFNLSVDELLRVDMPTKTKALLSIYRELPKKKQTELLRFAENLQAQEVNKV